MAHLVCDLLRCPCPCICPHKPHCVQFLSKQRWGGESRCYRMSPQERFERPEILCPDNDVTILNCFQSDPMETMGPPQAGRAGTSARTQQWPQPGITTMHQPQNEVSFNNILEDTVQNNCSKTWPLTTQRFSPPCDKIGSAALGGREEAALWGHLPAAEPATFHGTPFLIEKMTNFGFWETLSQKWTKWARKESSDLAKIKILEIS